MMPEQLTTSRLERAFGYAMIELHRRAKAEASYNASRFLQMVIEYGGLATAKILINAPHESDGYTANWERGRLALGVEALVVGNEEWHTLFSHAEIERARDRLRQYRYVA